MQKIRSKIFVTLITALMVSTIAGSSNVSTVVAQEPVTLEEIMAAIDALDERLDDIETDTTALNSALDSLVTAVDNLQAQLDSVSATTATTVEVAALDSALDELKDVVDTIQTYLVSLSGTAASKSEVDDLSSDIEELRIAGGAVTPVAMRFDEIEQIGRGKRVTKELLVSLSQDIGETVLKVTGLRWSSAYKLPVIQQSLYQMLFNILSKSGNISES